jgi:chromosome partitioning protein
MLDLDDRAGEDEVLEACKLGETIMRGLRRGRNKSTFEDEQDSGGEEQSSPEAPAAVTLVETPPPIVHEAVAPPLPASDTPVAPPRTVTSAGSTPFRETISQVATAHAELDNVLPPNVEQTGEVAPPRSGAVTISAPVAGELGAQSDTDSAPPPVDVIAESSLSDDALPGAPELDPVVEPVAVDAPVDVGDAGGAEPEAPAVTEDVEVPVGTAQEASGNPLPRVLAVANQKGGVGKTTTSVNLGAALAELGFRVLVIDLDPQGNATTGLGIDARNFELSMYDVLMRDASLEDCVEPTSMKNLFVAPATIALAGAEIELVPAFSRELKLKRSIESVIDEFDYVLIDCPPSLGLITVNALAAADEVLVPIQCEYYALEGLSQLMRNVHLVASNLNPKLDISTIVLTMYDARTKLSDQVANEVRLHFGAKVCRNVIPRTVRLSEAPSFGQPITAFDPASRGAIAYRELAKEVSGGTS